MRVPWWLPIALWVTSVAASADPAPALATNGAIAVVVTSPAAAEAASASASSTASTASAPAWAASAAERADALREAEQVFRHRMGLLGGALALVLGAGAVWLGIQSVKWAREADGLRFRTHWGGFGGSDGGWHASPAIAGLVGTAVLAVAAVALMASAMPPAALPGGGTAAESARK